MPDLTYDPPFPTGPLAGYVQTIRMTDAGKQIGYARWYVTDDGTTGVAQLLEITIAPPHRRAGHGQRLLQAAIEQIRQFFRARKLPLRRIWMNVNQKDQVNGRAMMTHAGFHHMGTVSSILKDQDALIYVLSLD